MAKYSDYGKGSGSSKGDSEMYLPGSPDARMYGEGDMYDRMAPISGYGKKVSTRKNRTGTGSPNTGIQGDATRSRSGNTQDKSEGIRSKGKSYQSDYGGPAGNPTENSVGKYDEYDYGKGKRKKGSKRKHIKAQGA